MIVTEFTDADERFPAASTTYTLYVPLIRPVAGIDVGVFDALMVAEFHRFPAAPVMLASFVTLTDDLTRYAVPGSVL